MPIKFYIHFGSEADITGLRAMAVDLPAGNLLYIDNAYTELYAGRYLNGGHGQSVTYRP